MAWIRKSWERLGLTALALAALVGGGLLLDADRARAARPETPETASGADIRGLARVIDGDTLEIDGVRIRLYGVDAFERSQVCGEFACGRAARQAMIDRTRDRVVECQAIDTDRYGRTVAQCFADGADLAAMLVRGGLAVAYRRYSLAYVADEDIARRAHAGVWAGAWAASFTSPEAHRRNR